MSNFLPPRFRATDANGAPIPAATLTFSVTGSATPLATYSDAALTSANTNPVVADGSGYFGAIYMQEAAYRVVLKDAAGVTIYSVDGVRNSVLSNDDLVTRLSQVATNPLDYGAIGDGAADESTQVQQAIDAATGCVDLLGKTFKCNTGLVLKSGITLRNGTLDFALCPDSYAIRILGTSTSRGLLAANATVGASSLTLASAAGIGNADLIILSKTGVWSSGLGDSGEMLAVTNVAGNVVTVAGRIRDTYNTANTAAVAEITATGQIVLESLVIYGAEASSGDLVLLDAKYGDGITIRDCDFWNFKTAGIRLDSCINVHVNSVLFQNGAASANGLDIRGASQDIFVGGGCQFTDIGGNGIRIGENVATNDWVTRGVYVNSCSFAGCLTNGMFVDKMAQHVRAYGCQFEASEASGDGFKVDTADDVSVFGCVFRGADDGIVLTNSPTTFSQWGNYFSVSGSAVDGGTASGLSVTGSGTATGVEGTGGSTSGRGGAFTGGAPNGDGCAGYGTGTGYGSIGSSTAGIGGYFISDLNYGLVVASDPTSPTKAAFRIVPQDSQPAGPNLVGDMYIKTSDGTLNICTVAGTPGTWDTVQFTP